MDATLFSFDGCYITDDILMEILWRLPLKSIFKFKSVCKGWLSLLSNPSFVDFYKTRMCKWTLVDKYLYDEEEPNYYFPPNYHLFNNLNSMAGSENYKSMPPSFSMSPSRWYLEFPEEENQKKTLIMDEILGSSNGWLLCTSVLEIRPVSVLHLINPLTMQCISLPNSFFPYEVSYGFVTKSEGDVITSYRVVTALFRRSLAGSNYVSFEVFSSETREWEVSTVYIDPHAVGISLPFDKFAFTLDNVLHWFNGATILSYHGGSGNKFRLISLPADRKIWTYNYLEGREELSSDAPSDSMCGVAQDGCITYVEMVGLGKRGFEEGGLSVWKLRDYHKGEWSLEHIVQNRDVVFDPPLWKPLTRLLAFHPLDSEIVYLEQSCDFVLSYNVRLRKLEAVQSLTHENGRRVICCSGHSLPFVLQWPTRINSYGVGSRAVIVY